MKEFFTSLAINFISSFRGRNIFWHLLAIVLTAIIVFSGLDWRYFLSVRGELLNAIFFPAVFLGFLLPILFPLGMIIFGRGRPNRIVLTKGWALLQAVVLSWIISAAYKSVTGRVQPDLINLAVDSSRNWNFGFWEHGIFWGWPSSHTTVAFALAAAFIVLFKEKNPKAKYLAIIYAFYVGIAVSFSIHWLSEFVAGAIIGTVVGLTVGQWWKRKLLLKKEIDSHIPLDKI